jgi:hypothetical protein
MTTLISFTVFPNLPLELQRSVWSWACQVPRVLEVDINKPLLLTPTGEFPTKTALTITRLSRSLPLLYTCRASHEAVRLYYQSRTFVSKGSVLFNPAVDIVYFGERISEATNDPLATLSWLTEKDYIQFLACDVAYSIEDENAMEFCTFIEDYRALKEVIFVVPQTEKHLIQARRVKMLFKKLWAAVKSSEAWTDLFNDLGLPKPDCEGLIAAFNGLLVQGKDIDGWCIFRQLRYWPKDMSQKWYEFFEFANAEGDYPIEIKKFCQWRIPRLTFMDDIGGLCKLDIGDVAVEGWPDTEAR